ncbi:hypothetical protein IMG5_106200 [Ichthyophthirius multifiliis]|uniref:Ion transport domain-containing protein n=1 Tax=Ichthyophthirius multifiliis TaxID=5932 RepID=G0QT52_ICHMU|nr:hypothetical protein IMG5_106200 [Ichthyophthirius multifiliis]EGR31607.1 hypothetical protein IMG5_106200 [Ichthyophthirius multifiliis]|eukprot:XP_004035093.1 hypothetical protein IMG5_106200 [Ichthyophthirius multifiliis]
MIFKILASGFLFNKEAYLRDIWNILDFIIVGTGYIPYILTSNQGVNLSSLRSLRILRPLRTISTIKSLRNILNSLFSAVNLLKNSIVVLLFFYIIFAIGGLQLFSGILKKRCIEKETGIELYINENLNFSFCAHSNDCVKYDNTKEYICGKLISNPCNDIVNFDTFGWSFLTVFQIVTMEGWSDILNGVQKTFSAWAIIYFLLVIFIGSFFLTNLTLAIITVKYNQESKKVENKLEDQQDIKSYDLHIFLNRESNIYQKKNQSFSFLKKDCTLNNNKQISNKNMKNIQNQNNNQNIQKQQSNIYINNKEDNVSIFSLNEKNQIQQYFIDFDFKEDIQLEQNAINYKIKNNKKKIENNNDNLQKQRKNKKLKKQQQQQQQQKLQQSQQQRQQNRQLTISKNINNQYQNIVNDEDFEADTFNPLFMKAHVKNDFYLDIYYDDVLPKKKNQQKEIQKQLQFQKIKNIRFLIYYMQVKKKIQKTKKQPNLKQQYKVIPLRVNIRMIQMQETYKKNNDFQNQYFDDDSIKQCFDNNQNKNNNNDFLSFKKVINFINQNSKSNNQVLVKQEIQNLNKQDNSLKNNFSNKKNKLFKKSSKVTSKSNYDYPIQIWDLQKAKELIFQTNKFIQINTNHLNNKNFQNKDQNSYSQDTIFTYNSQLSIINKKNNLNSNKQKANENETDLTELENIKFIQEPIEMEYTKQRKQQIENAEKNFDYKLECQWSLEEVLIQSSLNKSQNQFELILQSITHKNQDVELYEAGLFGILCALRRLIKNIVLSKHFDNFIMLCVVINTIVLTLDGVLSEQGEKILNQFNFSFTIIFTIDMCLKLLGEGILEYISDRMNIFDAIIVCLSLIELLMLNGEVVGGSSKFTAFKSIRILRVFRVLRVARLVRSLQFMKIMMAAIASNISSFIYILLLLFLFIFIYSLLGMQIFGGSFDIQKSGRMNFNNFFEATLSVFQLMTIENWNDVEVSCLTSSANIGISLLFLISWIFIGNYVLLNLLLAIVMDSFNQEELKEETEEYLQGIEVGQNIDFNNLTDEAIYQNQTITNLNYSAFQQSFGQNTIANIKNMLINEEKFYKRQQSIDEDDYGHLQQLQDINNNNYKFNSQNKQDFYDIECENAFFIFSQQNHFRILCYKIVKHPKFETVILIAIFQTSIKLVIDTYFDNSNPQDLQQVYISQKIDIIFTVFFTLEAFLKAISFGFLFNKNSYLREEWSQLDFFIVISSIIDISVESINLSVVKILRLLRTLRPLRFISHNRSMKLIVTALLESIGGIFNVIIVLLLVWIMFAILAINLMKGKLYYCNFPKNYNVLNNSIYEIHKNQCEQIEGAQWMVRDINFDNIGSGMLTLFVLSTIEGWPNYLFYFIDSDENGPLKNNSFYFALYFAVFILIGSLFLLNLFVAIMSFNYNLAAKKSKNAFLTDGQAQWIELQRLLVKSTLDYLSIKPPDNKYQLLVWSFCENKYLESVIMVFIILNIITMAMVYENQNVQYEYILNTINTFFTSAFIMEALLKIIAYGIRGYFYKGWNQFDFFVVMTSILDIIMSFIGNNFINFLMVRSQIARVFRVLKVSRLFRLIKRFQDLQKLIQTAIYSLPSLLNVTSLLFLVYFIFAILANFMFGNIKEGTIITSNRNFSNFHQSINLLFICSTGENWYLYMFDCINQGNNWAILFFVIYIIIVQFVMMNLFVLIIIDQFEQNYINTENPLNEFQEFEENFKTVWVKYTKQNNGIKINQRFLTDFYLELKGPQGFDIEEKKNQFRDKIKEHQKNIKQEELEAKIEKFKVQQKQIAAKNIMQMNILYDYEDGYVYYNELMFFIQKYALNNFIFDIENQEKILINKEYANKYIKGIELIKKQEKSTFKKIYFNKKKVNINMYYNKYIYIYIYIYIYYYFFIINLYIYIYLKRKINNKKSKILPSKQKQILIKLQAQILLQQDFLQEWHLRVGQNTVIRYNRNYYKMILNQAIFQVKAIPMMIMMKRKILYIIIVFWTIKKMFSKNFK